ncbi:MAG TPA: aminoglycoside phosphotransferase family protein [Methanoculleus sp.]|nr:aminoglycoside phosphotransferase family protein [Methanoculleus sp.]
MVREKEVGVLHEGDVFRQWLIDKIGGRIGNPRCRVVVSLLRPASHTVCKYRFVGEDYAVVAKFFAEPKGKGTNYNAKCAMNNEYALLKKAGRVIPAAYPVACSAEFNCVLVTEYVAGRSLVHSLRKERHPFQRIATVARMHETLHSRTRGGYDKTREFSTFHDALDRLHLPGAERRHFDDLLGEWWHSGRLDRGHGCMIHRDATLANYIFTNHHAFAVDFESAWEHAHPVHDAGIFCAELRHSFALRNQDAALAEPYIGHYLAQYCRDDNEFGYVTDVLPFFMSLGYLRIARLDMPDQYRNYLIREAIACLSSKG